MKYRNSTAARTPLEYFQYFFAWKSDYTDRSLFSTGIPYTADQMKQAVLVFKEEFQLEWLVISRLLFIGGGVARDHFSHLYPKYSKYLGLAIKTFQLEIPKILVSQVLFSK